jgi:hypothetical protein
MSNLTIKLTIDEVNIVLTALSNRPYFEVADLIAKIKRDCEAQLSSQETERRNNQ